MKDDVSWTDLAAAAPGSLGLAGKIAKAAQTIGCPLYRLAPGFFTAEADTQLPGFNQIGAKSIMDNACKNDPGGLPQQPFAPAFSGGQCAGVRYGYNASYQGHSTEADGSGGRDESGGPYQGNIWGPINTYTDNHSGGVQGHGPDGSPQINYIVQTTGNRVFTSIVVSLSNVHRLDGQADTCGDPPGGYNHSTPPGLTGNTTIDDPSGGSYPVPYTVIGPDPGSGGISFDIGGAVVNFGPTGVTIAPRIGLPGGGSGSGGGLTPAQADQLARAADGEGATPGKKPAPTGDTHAAHSNPPSSGNKKTGIKGLAYVVVDVTPAIANSQVQSGLGGPDVYYHVGWLWFTIGTYLGTRQPLDSLTKLFIAPPGADGYAFTVQEGYTGIVTEVQLKEAM